MGANPLQGPLEEIGPENRDYPLDKSSKSVKDLLVTYLKPATTDQQHHYISFINGATLSVTNLSSTTTSFLSTNRLPMTNNVDR
jgi:hypothetical protein